MILILIGMPGSGKSCMGRALARKLKMKNVDADRIIERRAGKKLIEIMNEDGLEAFKRAEEEALLSINGDNLIVSTGGSAVYSEEAMRHLKKIGHIMYLKVDYETIRKRLGNIKQRGVALREGQTLRDLYDERVVLYEKYADTVVEEKGEVEDVVVAILKLMKRK